MENNGAESSSALKIAALQQVWEATLQEQLVQAE